MRALQRFWVLIPGLVMVNLSGCVTQTIQEVREADTSMGAGDAVVVLGRRTRPTPGETESDFISCVSNGMSKGNDRVIVIDEQQFMDDLFPWFEPRTAPLNTSDLPELMNQPLLASRLNQMGLKYLVWIEGSTERTESGGSLTCTITAGAAGCFGFLSWEHDSSYEASVWDVESGKSAGRISSDAVGTSYMPAIVIPIPIIARVRASACNSLAGQLKSFVQNEG
jgi:hypothetical protein